MANEEDERRDGDHGLEIVEIDNPDDEFGYTDADWNELNTQEVELHDNVIGMSVDEITESLRHHISHLVRWAVAQVHADAEDFEVFDRIALSIVSEPWEHRAIDYEELSAELFVDACLEEDDERSGALIEIFSEQLGADDLEVARMKAFRTMVFEDRDSGLEAYQTIIDKFEDETELSVQVAYDFILFGEFDLAEEILRESENQALMVQDDDSVTLVREALQTLQAAREDSETSD